MQTTTNSRRIYPGLICRGVEFFNYESDFKFIKNGETKDFKDAPYAYHQIFKEEIEKDPTINGLLRQWYPTSWLRRIIQFGSCRFGGLDFQADIIDSKLQDGEYCDCSVRDLCPGAGILCRAPKYKGIQLTFFEVKILQLVSGVQTNEAIAQELHIPMGSYNLAKTKLYHKLGIQTKQEAAVICRDLNLI